MPKKCSKCGWVQNLEREEAPLHFCVPRKKNGDIDWKAFAKREAQAERMKCKNCHGKNIQLCQETETKRFYQCQDCFTEIRVRK